MSRGPVEPPIVARSGRVLTTAGLLTLLIVAVLGLAASLPGMVAMTQGVDDTIHTWVIANEVGVLVGASHALALLGGVWVTAPLRVVVGVGLALRRWWWRLAAWVLSIALSEVVTTVLKQSYGRPRPPGALEVTRSDAFPSGHAAATTATVVAIVLLLVPAGAARRWAGAVGAVLVTLMAASRVYLRVHWLSDVIVGVLVGAAAALLAIGVTALVQHRWTIRPRR